MVRLFRQHYVRKIEELDGIWQFTVNASGGNETCDIDQTYHENKSCDIGETCDEDETKCTLKKYSLAVPGCWEQHPDLHTYRGSGTYTRKIFIDGKNDHTIRFEFKGVSHTADVYLDGEHIAHHYNAYTAFSVIKKNVRAGEHELKVVVDNSFSEASSLHIPNDYYTYGGITRPVVLEELKEAYIKQVHFKAEPAAEKWIAEIEAVIANLTDRELNTQLCCELAGKSMNSEQLVLQPNEERKIVIQQEFNDTQVWSHETPKLYELRTVLQIEETQIAGTQITDRQIADDLIERVGFRTFAVEGNKLKLNGKEVFLKGFNRHEDYAGVGCAIPLQLMVQDMELMQDMGVNAVRTCHYPNDELFLDLCDERGILVWEENHARGLTLSDMKNSNFTRQSDDALVEMLDNHYNHPSIIIWGILNECASDKKEGRELYKLQYDRIRQMDCTRPATSATCKHFKDICLDLPDIVSFNMYSGWYQDVSVKERNRQEIDWIQKEGGKGKPIIVSELGAAAIYGYRDRSRCKWSEERQADLIQENLDVYMNDPDISGVFIWQFADCRVTEEGPWWTTRARCHNNKGIVDEYRRPKMAYDVVKELFTK